MNPQDPKYQLKSKAVSSAEPNYFVHFAMRHPVAKTSYSQKGHRPKMQLVSCPSAGPKPYWDRKRTEHLVRSVFAKAAKTLRANWVADRMTWIFNRPFEPLKAIRAGKAIWAEKAEVSALGLWSGKFPLEAICAGQFKDQLILKCPLVSSNLP